MKQITVPVTTTITENKIVNLPAFFQHDEYCFIAYFDKDKAIEVNTWPKTSQIGLFSNSIELLTASNNYYVPITEKEFCAALERASKTIEKLSEYLTNWMEESEKDE